jgi:hypothetical protein
MQIAAERGSIGAPCIAQEAPMELFSTTSFFYKQGAPPEQKNLTKTVLLRYLI